MRVFAPIFCAITLAFVLPLSSTQAYAQPSSKPAPKKQTPKKQTPKSKADTPTKEGDADAKAKAERNRTINKAIALSSRQQLEEAEKILLGVLKEVPLHEKALLALTDVYLRTKRNDKAAQLLEEATAKPEATPDLSIKLASVYLRTKQVKKAEDTLKKTTERYPEYVRTYVELAQFFSKNPALQEKYYKKALSLREYDRTALNNLAVLYTSQSRHTEALPLLETYARVHPKSPTGPFNLGSTYYSMGMVDKGVALYRKLLERRPKDSIVLGGLGLGLAMSGKAEEALSLLKEPASLPDVKPPVIYAMGIAHLFNGDAKNAKVFLDKAYRVASNQTYTVIAYAEALRQTGELKEARRILVRKRKSSAKSADLVDFYLALVLVSEKKETEAIALFKQAIRTQPNYNAPQDLKYLVRFPPKAVDETSKLLAGPTKPSPPDKASTPPPATPETSSGCNCAQPGGQTPVPGSVFLLLLGLIVLRKSTKKR